MCFARWMLEGGLAASTVTTYLSLTRSSLEAELGFKLLSGNETRLPRMMRALRRMFAQVRRRRRGWRASHQRSLAAAMYGALVTDLVATQLAVMCVAREALARAAELGPQQAGDWDPTCFPTVGDVSWGVDADGRFAILMLLPAKKASGQNAKRPVYLPEGDGEVDAYTSLRRMLDRRGTEPGGAPADDEPLFTVGGEPMRAGYVATLFRRAAATLGLEPAEFSGHSGRIGGATDLFACDAPPTFIQIAGRWDSDLWQIYSRQCVGHTLRWARRAQRCRDADVEGEVASFTQPATVTRGR